MTDAEKTAQAERVRLSMSFVLVAVSREAEAVAGNGDHRHIAAAACIRHIAGTLDTVEDAALLKLASVNVTSEGALSRLITVRLSEVGGALPLYADANAFFDPITAQVDQILHGARQHMH